MARMTITQSQAASELAKCLYDLLPGNPNPYADPTISFSGVASSLGLAHCWPAGSKTPAIARLLKGTFEQHSDKFCVLIEEIVKTSFNYKKGEAVTRERVEQINGLVKQLGFKIPSLWDPAFLRGLPSTKPAPPLDLTKQVAELKNELMTLASMNDAKKRGYAFERFLNKLFTVHGMQPRKPFKLEGEQIDGSIEINSQTYLIEARWRDKQANNADLLILKGKIDGKATWSRGIFISYSGFTKDGLAAFQRGTATNLICFCGQDLFLILENKLGLKEVIEQKSRKAAEEGHSYVPVFDLARIG